MTSAARECGNQLAEATTGNHDRAHRYRAQKCVPPGPPHCELCGSARFLVVDHRDGDEWNDAPANLRWLCKSCNTRLGIAVARTESAGERASLSWGEELGALCPGSNRTPARSARRRGQIIHERPRPAGVSCGRNLAIAAAQGVRTAVPRGKKATPGPR